MSAHYTTVWNGSVRRCCNARAVVAAVYEMLLLLSVTLPLNSCHAHVDSSNKYTHALTVVTRIYFSFTEPGYEARSMALVPVTTQTSATYLVHLAHY